MSISLRTLVAAVVVGALLFPGQVLAGAVVGSAGPSEAATVRGAVLQQGTNIFSGDVIEVAAGGEGIVTFGHNAMARFAELSAVRATRDANSIGLELMRGRMVFRATPEQPVIGTFADAMVKSEAGQEAVAIIAYRNPTLVAVTAERGTLSVMAGTEKRSVSVPQGQTVEVSLSDTPPAAGNNAPPPQQNDSKKKGGGAMMWATGVILGGGAVLGVALSQATNQTHLTCPQKGALVSPFALTCQ